MPGNYKLVLLRRGLDEVHEVAPLADRYDHLRHVHAEYRLVETSLPYAVDLPLDILQPLTAFMPKTLETCIMPMPRISMNPDVDSDDEP